MSSRGTACAVTVAALISALSAPVSARADWDYSGTLLPGEAGTNLLDAYTSEESVLPGGTIHFHVSTRPAEPYRILIYRLGWWEGSSPPQLACIPSCAGVSRGSPEPIPSANPTTGEIAAAWPVTDNFTVPSTWRSGYYVAKVVLAAGPKAGQGKLVPFIVREAPGGHRAGVLVIAGVDTWEAYNSWGGTSLYEGGPSTVGNRYPDPPHAVMASFDRPFQNFRVGGQSLFDWELPLARFLEHEGYDVSYTTDVDVQDSTSLLGRKLVIVAGHSEYWTMNERVALESARNAGVNLVFAGANDGYWAIRYGDSSRTIVGYKGQTDWGGLSDPLAGTQAETTKFRDLSVPDPECKLEGVEHGGLVHAPGYAAHVPDPTVSPWFANTGFKAGDTLAATVGYEFDQLMPTCIPDLKGGTPLTTLFHTDAAETNGTVPYDSVTFTAPSGARIFSAGTFEFSWGLDDYGMDVTGGRQPPDPRLQRFAVNMFDDLGVRLGGGLGTGIDRIRNLRIRPSTIIPAARGPSVVPGRKRKRGATVSYTGSQPATTTFSVQRAGAGRRQGDRCVKRTKRNGRHRRCTRYLTLGGFKHIDAAGANRFRFTGRVRHRKLRPGRYRLRAVPRNSAGIGPAAFRQFRVKRQGR